MVRGRNGAQEPAPEVKAEPKKEPQAEEVKPKKPAVAVPVRDGLLVVSERQDVVPEIALPHPEIKVETAQQAVKVDRNERCCEQIQVASLLFSKAFERNDCQGGSCACCF